MVVFDLEWNDGPGRGGLEEILQIGAVRVEENRLVDWFHVYIHPQIHTKLSRHLAFLPDAERSLASDLDFPAAYARFLAWCGADRFFLTWGEADLGILQRNALHWGLPVLEVERAVDLQALFSRMMRIGDRVALAGVVDYCGIPTPYCFHHALYDALYTAMLAEKLLGHPLLADVEVEARHRARRRRKKAAVKPSGARPVGPFLSREAALNSRDCRRLPCPICGRVQWVQEWRQIDGTVYTRLKCPDHGRYFYRLQLCCDGTGSWTALREAFQPDLPFRRAFRACEGENILRCTVNRRRRKRRRAWTPTSTVQKEIKNAGCCEKPLKWAEMN